MDHFTLQILWLGADEDGTDSRAASDSAPAVIHGSEANSLDNHVDTGQDICIESTS